MKNFLILLTLVLSFSFSSEAQNRSVYEDGVFQAHGRTADTLNLGGSKTYSVYVKGFAEKTKLQTAYTRSTGDTTSVAMYVESSLDFVNWTTLTTMATTSTDEESTGITALLTPYTQYIRVRVVPLTYTQTVKYKFSWLIDKN